MAAERLSKLQKWILVKCYQKTIKRDNSGFTILMKYRGTSELPANYWEYLYRDEILADYYKGISKNLMQYSPKYDIIYL